MRLNLDFDIENVNVIEFGVGKDYAGTPIFVSVPVDKKVQDALWKMVLATWGAMKEDKDGPAKYEPSNQHASKEYLYLSLEDELARVIKLLHEADPLKIDTTALSDPSHVFCYFARLVDKDRRRLTALRQSKQFKGILKSKNRLIRFVDDTLKIIEDDVFKLDADFDLLVDAKNVHILRPRGFEYAGRLKEAISTAVSTNIQELKKDLPFVNFDNLEAYAKEHQRAARYLASIRGKDETKKINKEKLVSYCKRVGVSVKEENGQLVVEKGHELDFLMVLDRRLYNINLVPNEIERYRATNRKRIDK